MYNEIDELQKSIEGLTFMSESLENMFNALLKNTTPTNWLKYSCVVSKNLPKWISEHKMRIEYLQVISILLKLHLKIE